MPGTVLGTYLHLPDDLIEFTGVFYLRFRSEGVFPNIICLAHSLTVFGS